MNNTYHWLKEVSIRFNSVRAANLDAETLTSASFNFNKKSAELEPVVTALEQNIRNIRYY